MKICTVVFCLLFCSAYVTFAQTGSCEPATGEAYLDAGNVRARILNNGPLFWRNSPHVYEVPKGDSVNAIFSASIWVGGKIDGLLHMAASTYGGWEFWPGPLDDAGNPPDDCKPYDQLWEINSEDIQAFQHTGEISENLATWPWELGAPVIDQDGIPNNYNLHGGDLPALYGDQRIWWVMNDRGNTHERSAGRPIGLQINASAHAFNHPVDVVRNSTFYEYVLINKNTSPLTDAYFSLYVDVDLGDFSDDYVGSDSLLHLAYAYNSDDDDYGPRGYGRVPPAIGYTFLETILADRDGLDNDRDGTVDEAGEKMGASSMMTFNSGGGIIGDPAVAADFYANMRAKWKNQDPLFEGFMGHAPRFPSSFPRNKTNFFFSGDPVSKEFWTELNLDRQGTVRPAADRRQVVTTGPFNLPPNDTLLVRFAIVWARGADHLDSVRALKSAVSRIQNASSVLFEPFVQLLQHDEQVTLPEQFVLGFDQNFPNPFTHSTTIRYSIPQSMRVRLSVYDALGREVDNLVDAQQEAGIYPIEFNAKDLPAGLYLARLELDHLHFAKRMIKVN